MIVEAETYYDDAIWAAKIDCDYFAREWTAAIKSVTRNGRTRDPMGLPYTLERDLEELAIEHAMEMIKDRDGDDDKGL